VIAISISASRLAEYRQRHPPCQDSRRFRSAGRRQTDMLPARSLFTVTHAGFLVDLTEND
jgi:hypothetical protein